VWPWGVCEVHASCPTNPPIPADLVQTAGRQAACCLAYQVNLVPSGPGISFFIQLLGVVCLQG